MIRGMRLFAMPGAPPLSSVSNSVAGTGDERTGRQILLQRADGVERDDVLETELRQGGDVRAVIDRVRRQRKRVAVAVDQDVLAAALVRHRTVLRLDRLHVPGRKERGVDDARATDERDFHGANSRAGAPGDNAKGGK